MKIAVLLTCFNRKKKTVSCLSYLYSSLDSYNSNNTEKISLSVFITDDGSTDGTSQEVKKSFADKDIYIFNPSDGPLYWAGGMRYAWKKSIEFSRDWDFFLLLNDDTYVFKNLFDEFIQTDTYCIHKHHKSGLYSGITCQGVNSKLTTYGGNVWTNKFLGKTKRLSPIGKPQTCDLTNANILFVAKNVVDTIGILYEGYNHGCADYDYSNMARKAALPVYVMSNFCGVCENDHSNDIDIEKKVISMTLQERKKYFNHPKTSNVDYLKFIKRVSPLRYYMVYLGRMINLYFPRVYYSISKWR